MNGSTEDDVDRLSDLPEVILHHIFSFLDIKQAGETCVLSKRWRNLWASLPFLNFNQETLNLREEELTAYSDFVDQVLLQRDNTCIQKLHLSFAPEEVNRANTWVRYFRNCKVQELSIALNYRFLNRPELLCGFFTFTSLKVLELYLERDHHLWCILPHTINLPVLQTLLLHGIMLSNPTFHKLFYACPILESLTIQNCSLHFSHLNISSPKLRQLVIDNDFVDYHYLSPCAIKLWAPNLLSFCCKDKILTDYSLENLSSLLKADILFGREGGLSAEKEELYTKTTMEVLRAVQNVTTLTLSGPGSIFQAFSESDAMRGTQFCNLRCLKVSANDSNNSNWIKGVTCLLKISPNIETISLTREMSDSVDVDVGDYQEAGLSLGNLKHLKFVEFKNVTGGVNELKFLENLLKNAVVGLEKLLIVFLPILHSLDRGRHRERFGRKLLALPTVSSSRVVMLIF